MKYKITKMNTIKTRVDNVSNSAFCFRYENKIYYLIFEMPDSGNRILLFERSNDDDNIVLSSKNLEEFNIITKEIYCSKSGNTAVELIIYPPDIYIESRTTLRYNGESITCLDKIKNSYLVYTQERGSEKYDVKQMSISKYKNLYHICDDDTNNISIKEVDNSYDIICYKNMFFSIDKNNIMNFQRAYKVIKIDNKMILCAGRIWIKEE